MPPRMPPGRLHGVQRADCAFVGQVSGLRGHWEPRRRITRRSIAAIYDRAMASKKVVLTLPPGVVDVGRTDVEITVRDGKRLMGTITLSRAGIRAD